MKKKNMWDLFVKTGDPMLYMLYKRTQENKEWKE